MGNKAVSQTLFSLLTSRTFKYQGSIVIVKVFSIGKVKHYVVLIVSTPKISKAVLKQIWLDLLTHFSVTKPHCKQ